jgi:hypothetical protein
MKDKGRRRRRRLEDSGRRSARRLCACEDALVGGATTTGKGLDLARSTESLLNRPLSARAWPRKTGPPVRRRGSACSNDCRKATSPTGYPEGPVVHCHRGWGRASLAQAFQAAIASASRRGLGQGRSVETHPLPPDDDPWARRQLSGRLGRSTSTHAGWRAVTAQSFADVCNGSRATRGPSELLPSSAAAVPGRRPGTGDLPGQATCLAPSTRLPT